jgi:signal transduction histidine kinase
MFWVVCTLGRFAMRWPLRYQIMLPMAAVMLITVVSVSGLGAWLAVRAAKARIESQINEVATIVADSNFPLTAPVLRQMTALSGADLVVVDATGKVSAASREIGDGAALAGSGQLRAGSRSSGPSISWNNRIELSGRSYFYTVIAIPRQPGDSVGELHILYPEDEYRRAWQQAVYPSLAFMAAALPVVLLLAWLTGSRLAGRVERLRRQVERIGGGEFSQIALPTGDDEIRALGEAVNRMAAMLANYEQDVRRTERMRTLAHLGGGIAHQLRNSATGCALAVDLHAAECPGGTESPTLAVAKRQLRLMEEYLQRFLQLGKTSHLSTVGPLDVAALVEDLLPLVEPAARHAGVDLRWLPGDGSGRVVGNAERLGQMVINLALNAIEAAAVSAAATGVAGRVVIELSRDGSDHVVLTVADSGAGPVESVRESLFEPFVTEKADGVGLGLSVAHDVVEQHGGTIQWRREGRMTYFVVELPVEELEAHRVEAVGCR